MKTLKKFIIESIIKDYDYLSDIIIRVLGWNDKNDKIVKDIFKKKKSIYLALSEGPKSILKEIIDEFKDYGFTFTEKELLNLIKKYDEKVSNRLKDEL